MRKFLSIILGLVLVVGLASCGESKKENHKNQGKNNNEEVADDNNENQIDIKDYFFSNMDKVKVFEGGFENGGETHYVEKVHGNKVQWKIYNGGTVLGVVYELSDTEIRCIYRIPEYYEFQDLIKEEENVNEIVLKVPISKDTTWKEDDSIISISGVNIKISTPAGEFEAVEISKEIDGGVMKKYFAKEIGLIKSVLIFEDGSEMGITLKEIKNKEV